MDFAKDRRKEDGNKREEGDREIEYQPIHSEHEGIEGREI